MRTLLAYSKMALIILMFLLGVSSQVKGLSYGFGQADYTRFEPNGVMVEVIKRQPNVGDFVLTVTPLSYSQFDSMGIQLPSDLPIGDRPDPAELEVNGRIDYIDDSTTVTFPASSFTGEETINVFIPFVDDDTNEPRFEGFYVHVTIDTVLSDPVDVANAALIRNGITLIRIEDDDTLFLAFQQVEYEVSEGDGMLNNTVFIEKQNGMASEQVLPILALLQPGSAIRGVDYQVPPTPIELVFETTDSRLPIPINVFEDALLEGPETFILFLSIPANPAQGYRLGTIPSTTITILDNDVGVIGFEMTNYTADEESGIVEVCVAILEPADLSIISPSSFVFFYIESVDGTAIGGTDYETVVAGSVGSDIVLDRNNGRMCIDITLIDDTIDEGNESFMLRFNFDENLGAIVNGNFRFEPNISTVVIRDMEVSPTPTPSPTMVGPLSTPTLSPTPGMTTGGDPHFSIKLMSGKNLCFSVQGEHGFVFNLMSNPLLQMNALFVPDAVRSEVTWLGSLGIMIKNNLFKNSNITKMRFVADEKMVYVGDVIKLNARSVEKLTFSKGKLTISEVKKGREVSRPEITVNLEDLGLNFIVRYTKNHLDMIWNNIIEQPKESHGIIGQFLRPGVEIDETRRLLLLPNMEPVAVMRKPVWHFMERDEPEDQLCWAAMNPGYQGKKLIEGNYLDYLVDNVLSEEFTFKPRQ